MSAGEGSKGVLFEEAHSTLAAGLKSCRAVVQNYRSLLSAHAAPDAPVQGDMREMSLESTGPLVSSPEEQ